METVCIREMAGAWLLRIALAGTPLHVNFSFGDRTLVLFLISDLTLTPPPLALLTPARHRAPWSRTSPPIHRRGPPVTLTGWSRDPDFTKKF